VAASPDLWFVYVVRCKDGSFYCGIAKDVKARIAEHNQGKGAKYTRGRGPVRVLVKSPALAKGAALRLEAAIKKLPRDKKIEALRARSASKETSQRSVLSP
jgi:putative endonuclease